LRMWQEKKKRQMLKMHLLFLKPCLEEDNDISRSQRKIQK
jgi:hypothetical protein